VQRPAHQACGFCEFYDSAHVHHRGSVGHAFDDREIMSDEEHRQRVFLLQIQQQTEDLRLNRDIQRGIGTRAKARDYMTV
jgi:hypothetical protein